MLGGVMVYGWKEETLESERENSFLSGGVYQRDRNGIIIFGNVSLGSGCEAYWYWERGFKGLHSSSQQANGCNITNPFAM
mmetsp:Transcript_19143/g.45971  ORF Transcript_19143/g.45971 Transcript_19143/m.45971 type:complete len:80 (+) Transcript_19143:55-294(+)